jgi:hypothetical protein
MFYTLNIIIMKKSILLSLIVLLIATVFISCDKEDDPVPTPSKFEIVSVFPENKATGVSAETNVVVTFSKPVSTIETQFGVNGGALLMTKKVFSEDNRVVTLDPELTMVKNTVYGFAIREAISEDGDTLVMFSKDGVLTPFALVTFTTEN